MKKSKFAEEQISYALKQAETGTPVAEVIRHLSLSQEILANFFDPGRIDFFVDRDPAKQGQLCLGRRVKAPRDIEGLRTVIANSIDFGPDIAADIAGLYPGVAHGVIQISDLLNGDA